MRQGLPNTEPQLKTKQDKPMDRGETPTQISKKTIGKTGTNHNPAMRTHIPCAPRTPITPVKSVEKKIIYEPKKQQRW